MPLSAQGSEPERHFAFGVVRHLFEPILDGPRPERMPQHRDTRRRHLRLRRRTLNTPHWLAPRHLSRSNGLAIPLHVTL
jgi:hypothetical protein